ncbi:MAG TPA: hypothetical protein VHZ74_10555 [Bryobacteraceae bacterium]|nr:hypothetical protein [Bryobacteraceae bacterium]
METGPEGQKTGACAVFRTIARLAPDLRECELKVLIAIISLFLEAPGRKGTISERDLAARAGVSRSNAQIAVASLAEKGLIKADSARQRPTEFSILLPDLASTGGPESGPPHQKNTEATLDHARRWIHRYHQRFRMPGYAAPPDEVVERLTAILDPLQIENLIHELTAERAIPDANYGWYIREALRRRRQPAGAAHVEARTAAVIGRSAH